MDRLLKIIWLVIGFSHDITSAINGILFYKGQVFC